MIEALIPFTVKVIVDMYVLIMGFTGGAVVKNLSASEGDARDVGLILDPHVGQEDSLEQEMATRSSILA